MKKKKIYTFDKYFLVIFFALTVMQFQVSRYLPETMVLLVFIGWGIFSIGGIIIGIAHLWILRRESWKYKDLALGLIIAGALFPIMLLIIRLIRLILWEI